MKYQHLVSLVLAAALLTGCGGTQSSPAFFMPVHTQGAVTTTGTYGYAVAGQFLQTVTPIAVCAVTSTKTITYPTGEQLEYGFRRGISYNIVNQMQCFCITHIVCLHKRLHKQPVIKG